VSTVPMRKLEIVMLKRDVDAVLEKLGEAGCFHVAEKKRDVPERRERDRPEHSATESAGSAEGAPGPRRAMESLLEIKRALGLSFPGSVPPGTKLPGPREDALVAALSEKVGTLGADEKANTERTARIREVLNEARAFAGLALPFRELDHLSFLALRVGTIGSESLETLIGALGDRVLIVPVDERGTIIAATSRNGRFGMDTELARAGFVPKRVAEDFKGLPPELPETLERQLAGLESERVEIARRKEGLRAEIEGPWLALVASYAVEGSIEEIKEGLEASEMAYRLEGWAPRDRVSAIAADIGKSVGGRVGLRAFSPREIESVRSGEEKVPVLLTKRPFISSFERLVVSYGTPLYGSVDPTPFVAFFFVLLFAIMFGDLGQGALIALAGLALRREWIPSLKKWKVFSPIVIALGIGSMIMGLLEGSFFTSDAALAPLTRAVTGALLGRPMDRILSFMPTQGMDKMFAFFGFTLGVGVAINSIGLVINIVNKLREGHRGDALFSKTGVAGTALFWWALGIAVRAILGGGLAWFDAIGLGLPLVALFFEEPLAALIDGHPRAGDGVFAAFVKGFVAVLESVSYFLSNSLSFLRVGAFALSHGVLSLIVFMVGEMIGKRAPAGILWQALVLIVGNAVILVLEGMIVAIQVVRLQYYEFLSKFLTETGRPFEPFRFHYAKEKP
jgi:V/A-type H+-transporting ATPase subunit I